MVIFILSLIAAVLLWLLYRYIPSRKVFAAFCTVLIVAAGIVYFAWPRQAPAEPALSAADRQSLLEQQELFASWYKGYQKDLTDLDRQWQWYHQILEAFKEDSISIEVTYVRLQQLEKDSLALEERIAGNAPPLELDSACYDQLASLLAKTRTYAATQHRTIALTRAAADPQHQFTQDQAIQSHELEEVMLRESPTKLFIADEIMAVRDYLTIPRDSQ